MWPDHLRHGMVALRWGQALFMAGPAGGAA